MASAARGLLIALEGPSGVGKSTVSRLLGSTSGAVRSREAWERLSPQPSLELGNRRALLSLEERLLKIDAQRYREALSLAENGSNVWLDTGTLGPITYSAGLAWLTGGSLDVRAPLLARAERLLRDGRWGIPDLIVLLELPPEELLARGIRSGRHPPTLLARHLLVARYEGELYRSTIARALPDRVVPIAARGTPHDLAHTIRRTVRAATHLKAATAREARRVLRALR